MSFISRILERLQHLFKYEATVYSHRDRSIETVAHERGLDIAALREETRSMLAREGEVETVIRLRRRYHVPLNAAWRFVESLNDQSTPN